MAFFTFGVICHGVFKNIIIMSLAQIQTQGSVGARLIFVHITTKASLHCKEVEVHGIPSRDKSGMRY